MNKLLVLTADADQTGPDATVVVTRPDGSAHNYIYVATLEGLLHYRHEAFSEAHARRMIA
jgi:cytochrome c2